MSQSMPPKGQLRGSLRRCHSLPRQGWPQTRGLHKDTRSSPQGRLPRKVINAWRNDWHSLMSLRREWLVGKSAVIWGHKFGLWDIRESFDHQNDRPDLRRIVPVGIYSLDIHRMKVVLLVDRHNFQLGPAAPDVIPQTPKLENTAKCIIPPPACLFLQFFQPPPHLILLGLIFYIYMTLPTNGTSS